MPWLGWRAWKHFALGDGLIYDGVGLRLDVDGALECTVSSTRSFAQVTVETARADLSRADEVLSQLSVHPAFSALTSGRAVRTVLVCDCGDGLLALATRTTEGLLWSSRVAGAR